MRIAQISDLHISTPDSRNDTTLRTVHHLKRAVDHLNRLAPDLTLITGDLVERGSPEEYTRLKPLLDGLRMPFYLIPGNHDHRQHLVEAFPDHPYLPKAGFLQYVVEGPVRLIALDTVIPKASGGELCEERLAWLDARLGEQPNHPTVLFMHHPPFATGIGAIDAMGLTNAEGFAALVQRHPQVERIVCGHVHRPITRRFAGTVVSTCPSTAHQLGLDLLPERKMSLAMEPPTCLLHVWVDGALVTHQSVIGTEHPPVTIFDGERWFPDPVLPAGFHPA